MTVSVALCTYNGEKYIEEQMRSIISQTRLPEEIVVCDDNSHDSTLRIVEEFASKTTVPLRIIRNERNIGYVRNFERAIKNCKCDIVFFCDQDDIWMSSKIAKMASKFEEDPNTVLCFCDAIVTDENLETIENSLNKYIGISSKDFFERSILHRFPYGCCMAVKRSAVAEWMPFAITHDHSSALNAPLFGTIAEVSERLMIYRRHSGTTTNTIKNKQEVTWGVKTIF